MHPPLFQSKNPSGDRPQQRNGRYSYFLYPYIFQNLENGRKPSLPPTFFLRSIARMVPWKHKWQLSINAWPSFTLISFPKLTSANGRVIEKIRLIALAPCRIAYKTYARTAYGKHAHTAWLAVVRAWLRALGGAPLAQAIHVCRLQYNNNSCTSANFFYSYLHTEKGCDNEASATINFARKPFFRLRCCHQTL